MPTWYVKGGDLRSEITPSLICSFSIQCPKSFRAMQMGLVGTQAQIAANVGVK